MTIMFLPFIAVFIQCTYLINGSIHDDVNHLLPSRSSLLRDHIDDVSSTITKSSNYINMIKDTTYSHYSKQHTFLIQVKNDCGYDCHSLILKALEATEHGIHSSKILASTGPENSRYQFLTQNIAFVSASIDTIDTLLAMHPNEIVGYAPLLPSMKLHSSLELAHTHSTPTDICNDKTNSVDNDGFHDYHTQLMITVAPLSVDEHATFIDYIQQLQESYFYVSQDDIDRSVPHDSNYIALNFKDCTNVHTIIDALSSRREVMLIEKLRKAVTFNRWAGGVCESGSATDRSITSSGLDGTGEVIGVVDTGIDMNSCYFYDHKVEPPFNTINHKHRKVVSYVSYPNTDLLDNGESHGTHVAGTAAGASYNSYGDLKAYNGVAYGAKIAFFDIGVGNASSLTIPSQVSAIFDDLKLAGAYIHSNSWGSDYNGGTNSNQYGTRSAQIDTWLHNNRDSMVLFANGNSGTSNSGRANLVDPATFKNGLSVGASGNDAGSWDGIGLREGVEYSEYYTPDAVAFFSSRGPTLDNRIKPEILAPGWWVNSAKGIPSYVVDRPAYTCGTQILDGTSMATPAVSGSAAIIRQYLVDGYYPSGVKNTADSLIPSGALLKALLMSSAQRMTYTLCQTATTAGCVATLPQYPDNNQGYGRLQLDAVLNFGLSSKSPLSLYIAAGANDTSHPLYASISQGVTDTYTFRTSAKPKDVRVTLVFVDLPSAATTGSPMKNKLTLSVIDSSNYARGPLISTANTVYILDIAASQVNPNSVYTVTVTGSVINSATQPYALVITGDITKATSVIADDDTFVYSQSRTLSDFAVRAITVLSIVSMVIICFSFSVYASNYNRAAKMQQAGLISIDEMDDEMLYGRAATRAARRAKEAALSSAVIISDDVESVPVHSESPSPAATATANVSRAAISGNSR